MFRTQIHPTYFWHQRRHVWSASAIPVAHNSPVASPRHLTAQPWLTREFVKPLVDGGITSARVKFHRMSKKQALLWVILRCWRGVIQPWLSRNHNGGRDFLDNQCLKFLKRLSRWKLFLTFEGLYVLHCWLESRKDILQCHCLTPNNNKSILLRK